MSLINDALRRARQAQQPTDTPSPAGPQLRPVEPAQHARHGLGLVVPAALGVIALLLLFVVWRWAQTPDQSRPTESRSQTTMVANARSFVAGPAARPAPPQPIPERAAAVCSALAPADTTAPAPALANSTSPALPPDDPSPEPAQTSAFAAGAVTNPPVPVEAPSSTPPPLKLQGIVFNPTRPSALISGKTLFIGDRIGEYRVADIGQDSATLVAPGKTNVVNLPE